MFETIGRCCSATAAWWRRRRRSEMKPLTGLAVAGVFLCLSSPLPGEIINGGFETGDLTGWTTSGEYGAAADVSMGRYLPTEGLYCAELETVEAEPREPYMYAVLEQQFHATAGQTLIFDWYGQLHAQGYAFEGGTWESIAELSMMVVYTSDPFAPLWDNHLGTGPTGDEAYSCSTGGWVSEAYPIAETDDYTLQFRVESLLMAMGEGEPLDYDPMTAAYIAVDNVYLIPEPSTLILFSMAALGLLAYTWRR